MYKSLDEYINDNKDTLIRLHIGCGSKYWDQWCNIDAYPYNSSDTHRGNMKNKPDIWADLKNLSNSNNIVDTICTQHVLEHFYRHEVISIFKNFYNLLKPGGVIITEMPDLNGVLNLIKILPFKPYYQDKHIKNRDIVTSQLYGASWESNSRDYPYHKYVWERDEFCSKLEEIGFQIVLSTGATKSHVPFRDMAVICQKPLAPNKKILSKNSKYWKKKYGNFLSRIFIQLKSITKLFLLSLK